MTTITVNGTALSTKDMLKIVGHGPMKSILAYIRQDHVGANVTLAQLGQAKGVGERTLEKIQGMINAKKEESLPTPPKKEEEKGKVSGAPVADNNKEKTMDKKVKNALLWAAKFNITIPAELGHTAEKTGFNRVRFHLNPEVKLQYRANLARDLQKAAREAGWNSSRKNTGLRPCQYVDFWKPSQK